MLAGSHLLDRGEQITRDLLIQRVMLRVEIGRLKNRVISYLKRGGVSIPPRDGGHLLFGEEGSYE